MTISRAEYDELKSQNQWLLEQLGLAKKRQFGSSSEKTQEEIMEQMVMTFGLTFNEAEANAYGTKSATAEQISVKAHARKRQSGSVEDVVPEGTPTEVVEHRLAEEERICSACGAVMEEIGKEVRRSLKMEPARFWIQEDVYYTYACKNCEQETGEANILKTPKEPVICPGSFVSPETVAHIMIQKFVMYSPLYRLEQEFGRQGLKLSRQTMSNWILNASDTWLRPVYDVLHRELCREKVLHGDETTLQVLKEAGKSAASKSYMWLYRTSGCGSYSIVLYEYQPNRKAEHAEEFLDGFSGWLHADGYQGYHKLPGTQPRAQRSGSRLERRSKGANVVFAAGGNGVERTLRRRVGLMPGENSMRRYRHLPRMPEQILWRRPVSAIAQSCSNWRSLLRN